MSADQPSSTTAPSGGGVEPGLPTFIQRRPDGVFVDPAKMQLDNAFRVFVERLFSQGARFSGLDYDAFLALLYGAPGKGKPREVVRLAREIVTFPGQRQALYKSVKIVDQGASAEYMFEPAFLEIAEPSPEPDQPPSTRLEPTRLDVDEFVAAMWLKGVCFGIDVALVAQAIAAGKPARHTVAVERLPVPSEDARLHEEWAGMHRDDSPLIRNGIADLRRHKNRFPQVRADQRMLRKIPTQPGEPGFKVGGQIVEPARPKDIDLRKVSGPGTRVEEIDGAEYVVAAWDGFLAWQPGGSQVSVTEKIDDNSGVSAKTTGNLHLTVDEFVERGEVQDGCSVEGRHMTFMAAVYGDVVSAGGRIEIKDCLSGGSARSPGGSITVERRASNARIDATDGTVRIEYAENCSILGKAVHIVHAVNCDIVAETLEMRMAQGCSVAAQSIDIETTNAKNDRSCVVSVLLPDLGPTRQRMAELDAQAAELRAQDRGRASEAQRLEAEPDFAKFRSITQMLREGKLKFTPVQEQSFHLVQVRHQPAVRALEKIAHERKAVLQQIGAIEQERAALEAALAAMSTGRRCRIRRVIGDTVAQQKPLAATATPWGKLSRPELARALAVLVPPALRIAPARDGSVEWTWVPPDAAAGH